MSVTAAGGFVAWGVSSGIKPEGRLDMALVATTDGREVPAAATFTSNKAAAAPVQVSRDNLASSGGRAGAILINSGNANAATGQTGVKVASSVSGLVAAKLGLSRDGVLCCSTGLIGIPLSLEPFERGIPELVGGLGSSRPHAERAAQAIMTTDNRRKEVVVGREGWSVGAMAKGAAMLAPNMATMLAILTTDASVGPEDLALALRSAVAHSFNEMSVDGCCSTNDTVAVLASGLGAAPTLAELTDALTEACEELASQMADDAEGATKVATVIVVGALNDDQAARAARRVAQSQLVQSSLHGADPYWGRVVSELGSAGVAFDLDSVSVSYGGIEICRQGVGVAHDEVALAAHMAERQLLIRADLGLGQGSARMLTTSLSPEYVDLNATTS